MNEKFSINFLTIFFASFFMIGHSLAKSDKAGTLNERETEALLLQFVPPEFKQLIVDGQSATFGRGIGHSHVWVKIRNQKSLGLVAMYDDINGRCSLKLLMRIENKWAEQQETILQYPDQIKNCFDLTTKDLDQDGQDEVLVETGEGRETSPPKIFRMEGRRLIGITPLKEGVDGAKISAFRNVMIADKPVQNKLLIVDMDEDDPYAVRKIYELRNGNIVLQGSYDFVSFVGPKKPKNEFTVLKPSFTEDGQYTLNVKNLSDHKRTVRAEIVINGSVVLKPQDFCEKPQPQKTNKDKWAGNDDDDDYDEDRCKRCDPRKQVYTIVNLKKENEIKVKVFGKKDSKIELSLVKK